MRWPKIKRGVGRHWVKGKSFRLAEEVRYIQRRAAQQDSRIVSLGQVPLFSSETGDAWVLDVRDQLATLIARDGDPLSVHIDETEKNFAIGWNGYYQIDGEAFVYRDKDTGSVRTIFGYPTQQILGQISNIFG
jgi:hypothetical protein